jgi:hypothetical protein
LGELTSRSGQENAPAAVSFMDSRQNQAELPLTCFFAAGIYPALFYQNLEHIANSLSS